MHEIEDETALIAKLPYTSCVMSDRISVIDSVNFSMKSTFQWENQYPEGATILSDRNLTGTLNQIQHLMLKDGSTLLSFKPLPGSNFVDLMGQYMPTEKMKAFVASDQ